MSSRFWRPRLERDLAPRVAAGAAQRRGCCRAPGGRSPRQCGAGWKAACLTCGTGGRLLACSAWTRPTCGRSCVPPDHGPRSSGASTLTGTRCPATYGSAYSARPEREIGILTATGCFCRRSGILAELVDKARAGVRGARSFPEPGRARRCGEYRRAVHQRRWPRPRSRCARPSTGRYARRVERRSGCTGILLTTAPSIVS